ncbi:hypothetical protein [Mesorhizobium sp. M0195]|uniref:hypothetical protein n=1 Tax=Mesorhizobium sp. M0195 TaxID=2956910 RepID=UPI003339795D
MLGIYDPTERQRVIAGGLDGGIMSGDFVLQAREECRNLGVVTVGGNPGYSPDHLRFNSNLSVDIDDGATFTS